MNPYGDASGFSSTPYSASNLTYSFDPPKPPFIQTNHSSLPPSPVVHFPSDDHVRTSSSTLPLPAFSPTASSTIDNPYPPPTALHSHQVSIPSPDLQSSPPQTECFDENSPDLECAICFSQFNNIFRCPKMLNCKHTFCLECLARMNVKSCEPSAIQCPLCRGLTPLPPLGLPKLATDSDVLSYLPAAMQRVYSIRFIRNKGKLQVKRTTDGPGRQGRRSVTSLRSVNRSLDVGLPSPSSGDGGRQSTGIGGALFRLTGRPGCRAFLLTSVVLMMVLLTGVIIFLLTLRRN
ncbi:RING finger protein 223 isoform X1 [Girardinichthys multiradiatus]|uniref:RING finger protein 223 isoform X1 n=1 Tax=Girardinichthys multiradiatus TaxID=208333 RepID=UPI001FAB8789|nr:RING finger protein 223 isoform X1 [Girardinichthys multiradiatus]XP_047236148.1 RING finger protein 223 isoform X1 [Girardinichthys multiradiatus]XP_047236149.1 RING finger protein 223 isoform X1 [Girardinichthys multiradiatus]XP_047236150.1 RING finger protein 223 isoform X1 [Girardinichthys multiradiatus]XP_047236151.1 RING finger protein 223 isoform X1 [Girardinichthys multiradiatus]XP_047236152.1 RING finger protein 223 isoform X1 [Girardinichthys multiradiatus]XP_047236153.1 RING fin